MSYNVGGIIDAADYNQFVANILPIYGDVNSGATGIGAADLGYGKTTTLAPKNIGDVVTAADWTNLFGVITACGIHQGVSTSPIPASVTPGNLITAYNSYLTTQTLKVVIGSLLSNRLNVAPSQVSTTAYPNGGTSVSWTTGRRYTFTVQFATYDDARHFFNTGGAITISGSYVKTVSPTPADIFWTDQLTGMGTIKFNWNNTSPINSTQGKHKGFYSLTGSEAEIYRRSPISDYVYYSNDFIRIMGSLTGGNVQLSIELIENDSTATAKTGLLTYNVSVIKSVGSIPFTPSYTVSSGAFTNISNIPYNGPGLIATALPTSVSASTTGAGTVTTQPVTATPFGGDKSHSPAIVATTTALPSVTYSTAGTDYGRLTATSNGALVVDGATLGVNNRILVKNQATASQNGIYVVVTPGNGSTPFVLERATDMPRYISSLAAPWNVTDWSSSYVKIGIGTYVGQYWRISTANPIQIGTTALTWVVFPAPYTYNWSVLSGDAVSFSSPTGPTTTLSKALTAGQISSGQVKCDITDVASGQVITVIVPWSLTSSSLNI